MVEELARKIRECPSHLQAQMMQVERERIQEELQSVEQDLAISPQELLEAIRLLRNMFEDSLRRADLPIDDRQHTLSYTVAFRHPIPRSWPEDKRKTEKQFRAEEDALCRVSKVPPEQRCTCSEMKAGERLEEDK
jgi:hypothetical protein